MHTSKRNGAVLDDGSLNINLLQNEINRELSCHLRYRAEDEMKKKAVLISRDYEEFRNFVTCSQLKPVHRTEIGELFNPSSTALNCRSSKINKVFSSSENFSNKNQSNIPSTQSSSQNHSSLDGIPSKLIPQKVEKKQSQSKLNRINRKAKRTSFNSKKELDFKRHWGLDFQSPRQSLYNLISTSMISAESSSIGSIMWEENSKTNSSFSKIQINYDLYSNSSICMELDANMLGNILQTLHLCLEIAQNDDGENKDLKTLLNDSLKVHLRNNELSQFFNLCVYHWMVKLSESSRFCINILFLNDEQKSSVESLFSFFYDHLDQRNKDCNKNVQMETPDQQIFSVTEKRTLTFSRKNVLRLKSLYNCTQSKTR